MPLFSCSVILKYLSASKGSLKEAEIALCAFSFWIQGRSMIVYVSWAKQVMVFLQILADNTPITEPGMTRVAQSWKGHGTGAG